VLPSVSGQLAETREPMRLIEKGLLEDIFDASEAQILMTHFVELAIRGHYQKIVGMVSGS
jgi:hypothetical protein